MDSKMTMNQTIADKIYKKLKEDITTTIKIKLGQRVNIKKISEDFGISQIPIREALNRLVKDNLIVYKPRRGYYVIKLFYEDMEEIYKLREYFECLAIELLGSKKNNQIPKKLQSICEQIDISIKNKNFSNQRMLNFQFHQLIINSSGSQRLIRFYNEIEDHLRLLDSLTDKFHEEPKISNQEHWAIANALENGGISLAIEKMHQHIKSVIKYNQKQILNYFSEDNLGS